MLGHGEGLLSLDEEDEGGGEDDEDGEGADEGHEPGLLQVVCHLMG